MPPKPFNPPRPRASTSNDSASKPRGRPKGTTNKSDSAKKSAITTKSKSAKEKDAKRISSSRFAALPSLSPDTRRELEGTDEDEDRNRNEDSDIEMLEDRIASSQQDLDDEDDDPFASPPSVAKPKSKSRPSTSRRSDAIDVDEDEEGGDNNDRKEKIPEELLSVILHQFFKHEGTRMHKDANKAVARYMEVFVREGIARAVWGRDQEGIGGGLEVEDLEKLAPQLILDF